MNTQQSRPIANLGWKSDAVAEQEKSSYLYYGWITGLSGEAGSLEDGAGVCASQPLAEIISHFLVINVSSGAQAPPPHCSPLGKCA